MSSFMSSMHNKNTQIIKWEAKHLLLVSSIPSTVESHQYYINSVCNMPRLTLNLGGLSRPQRQRLCCHMFNTNPLAWWQNLQLLSSVKCMEFATYQHHLLRAQNCACKQTYGYVWVPPLRTWYNTKLKMLYVLFSCGHRRPKEPSQDAFHYSEPLPTILLV